MSTNFDLPDAKIGDTFLQPFKFIRKDDSTPVDQSGLSYRFSLGLDPTKDDENADEYFEITVPATPDAEAGVIMVRFEHSETALLKPASYYYELKKVTPATPEDILITLLHGKVKFSF